MLVISRKEGESLLVGEDIEIRVLDVQGDKVRIGISAPRQMPVMRKELMEIETANREAESSAGRISLDNLLNAVKNAGA